MFSPTVSSSCSTSLSFPSASGLLGRDLELLHVLTDSFQFLLDILEFSLCQLSTLCGPLALVLLDTQLPGQLIQLLLVVAGHLGGFSEGLVQLLNLDLIPHGLGFKVLDLFQNAISLLGCHGQFGDSVSKGGVSLLGFLLH